MCSLVTLVTLLLQGKTPAFRSDESPEEYPQQTLRTTKNVNFTQQMELPKKRIVLFREYNSSVNKCNYDSASQPLKKACFFFR